MAKNGSKGGGRKASVKNRTQFLGPNGNFTKRDTKTGRFIDQKTSGGKFKGVATEVDGRRD